MKKAFALVVLMVTPTMAFAQGTVIFENQTGLVKQWTSVSDSTLVRVPVGGGYVQLIAAPEGTPFTNPLGIYERIYGLYGFQLQYSSLSGFVAANPGWVAVAPPTGMNLAAGVFDGGNVTINDIAAGGNAEYIVIGWTGNYTTLDDALASGLFQGSFFGESVIATTATGDSGTPVSLSTTFGGVALGPELIPEPSSFALAGLGLAALLVLRRRRESAPLTIGRSPHRLRLFASLHRPRIRRLVPSEASPGTPHNGLG